MLSNRFLNFEFLVLSCFFTLRLCSVQLFTFHSFTIPPSDIRHSFEPGFNHRSLSGDEGLKFVTCYFLFVIWNLPFTHCPCQLTLSPADCLPSPVILEFELHTWLQARSAGGERAVCTIRLIDSESNLQAP